MKRLIQLAAVLCLWFAQTGCEDPAEAMEPMIVTPVPDGVALNEKFLAQQEQRMQTFTVNGVTGGEVTLASGTIVSFPEYSFRGKNGALIEGDVSIELIELYRRKDMLFTGRPTNGRQADGSLATLVSGGQFYVNARKDDVELTLAKSYTLIVPVSLSGGADADMKMFNGIKVCEEEVCNLAWEEAERGLEIGKWQTATSVYAAYYAFQSKFGWTNIDKWYSDPRPKTTLHVDLPDEYNNTNCAVYLSYDGEPRALAQFDKYDKTTGLFTEHYGLIPVGLKVHFLVVSVVDEEWHYAIVPATIGENHVQVIDKLEPVTETALEDLLEDLP